ISTVFKVHLSLFFAAQFFINYLTLPAPIYRFVLGKLYHTQLRNTILVPRPFTVWIFAVAVLTPKTGNSMECCAIGGEKD
ncbi:MAG: hypothetical protein K2O83_04510, partial [Schaedlerella arabinosiphila]|nr:hypothetical protein [Schaedlerella arabinosiphila]